MARWSAHGHHAGPHAKFVAAVERIAFAADYVRRCGQEVLYVTERAVFRLDEAGVRLIEVAPGIDIERDILAHMGFVPLIGTVEQMDAAVFL